MGSGSNRAKQRASALREFNDAHQEYQETKSKEAVMRRNAAMRKGTSDDYAAASDRIITEMTDQSRADKDFLRDCRKASGSSGWKRKG